MALLKTDRPQASEWRRERKSFARGGVHPHDFKSLSRDIPIRNAPVPAVSIVPMSQHMGKPAQCVVEVGDSLKEGMLIGKADGFFSANVHSPVPGNVTEMRDIYLPNGIRTSACVIEMEGEFERSGKSWTASDWREHSGKELLDKINDMGIVGLGGATFPAHVKFFIREGMKAETFVVNGVECEPFLTGDHRLMLEKYREILGGAQIVQKILGSESVYFGIEENKPDAIMTMTDAIQKADLDYRVVPLKVRYPQGDEKQLLKAVTGLEVPSGGLPIDIGAVVSNVGSVYAIYEAVVYDKPLIERCLTVTGSIIRNPANLKARIGTPIGELIEDCGGFSEEPGKLVAGGPMMGFSFFDLSTPVTKGTSGILALSKKESRTGSETNCLNCGKCVFACAFGLSPTYLYKLVDHRMIDEAVGEGLIDCKECGCCAYVCPARIPLVQGLKLGKLLSRRSKGK